MYHSEYKDGGLVSILSKIVSENPASCFEKSFKKKGVIYEQDQSASSFIFILSGKVNIVKRHHQGDFIVASIGKNEIVGEMGLFSEQKLRTTTLIADEPVRAYVISYLAFMDYIKQDYTPLFYITQVIADRLNSTTRYADAVATLNVKDRIVNLFVESFNDPFSRSQMDGSVVFKMSRKEISSRVGCSRELAGRCLKELKEQGLIDYSGMEMHIRPQIKTLSLGR